MASEQGLDFSGQYLGRFNTHLLVAAQFSLDYGYLPLGHLEGLGQIFGQVGVGLAVHRWRSNGHLELFTM